MNREVLLPVMSLMLFGGAGFAIASVVGDPQTYHFSNYMAGEQEMRKTVLAFLAGIFVPTALYVAIRSCRIPSSQKIELDGRKLAVTGMISTIAFLAGFWIAPKSNPDHFLRAWLHLIRAPFVRDGGVDPLAILFGLLVCCAAVPLIWYLMARVSWRSGVSNDSSEQPPSVPGQDTT